MGKINLKISAEELNILNKVHEEGNFEKFNEKFAEITGRVDICSLVDKMNEVYDEITEFRKIIHNDTQNLLDRIEPNAQALVNRPARDNNNLNYFNEYSGIKFPDFVKAAEAMRRSFLLMRDMTHRLDMGYRVFVRTSEKDFGPDNRDDYFKTDEEVSKYLLRTYNLSVNFKVREAGRG